MVVKSFPLVLSLGFIFLMAISGGCISQAEPVTLASYANVSEPVAPAEILNATQPLVKNEIVYSGETYEEWMYRTGGKKVGQEFNIIRNNVSGFKSMHVNVKIAGARFLPNYRQSASDSWGTHSYWPVVPDAGKKFLFIYAYLEMEGDDQSHDPRMWGFDSQHFTIDYQGQLISEDPNHVKCVVIKEMEDIPTTNQDSRIMDYGKLRVQSMDNPLQGIGCYDLGYLKLGQSNAWDGYIIYQVPREATMQNLTVIGSFDGFGSAWWELA